MNKRVIVSSIFTEDYRSLVELQKDSCRDDYIFSPIFIDAETWSKNKKSEQFAFWNGNTIKIDAVIKMIKENMNEVLIFTDADLVFLSETKEDILSKLTQKDILFLKERRDTQPQYERAKSNINIGFVAMNCNTNVLEFWEKVRRITVSHAGWDQEVVNDLLSEDYIGLSWALLPECYLNGGSITSEIIGKQRICTACGTIAERNGLSKEVFLKTAIKKYISNEWF